ncbi:MAG: hypothetical protein CL912_14065 [Deltaproteobacteria bacterium]|nr:hypothetical protein [Deltaproteobacteria bacterium]
MFSRRPLYFRKYEWQFKRTHQRNEVACFLILKNYIQIKGNEAFNFSNTKNASFTIWWEFAVLTLNFFAIVAHF